MKMSFICMRMKNHFHIKGSALNLVLIQRPGGTRKWPIGHFVVGRETGSEMDVKCIVGLSWGTHFQYGGNFFLKTVPKCTLTTNLNLVGVGVPIQSCGRWTQPQPGWCWCPNPIPWEVNSFLMQTLSFVSINLHRCWPLEWKRSINLHKSVDRKEDGG